MKRYIPSIVSSVLYAYVSYPSDKLFVSAINTISLSLFTSHKHANVNRISDGALKHFVDHKFHLLSKLRQDRLVFIVPISRRLYFNYHELNINAARFDICDIVGVCDVILENAYGGILP